ncbi:MAG: VOC family protein [Clostridia bacterium]|nr:VOC family protein [Clostridia bacterium]
MYKLLHTCIRVMDLEASLKFYEEVLGFKEKRRKDFPEHAFTLVFIGNERSDFEIELTYNYHPEKPYVIGNGFSHIAVEVEDLEASHETHQALDYKITHLMGLPGAKPGYYFITDPDGYDVEIIRSK